MKNSVLMIIFSTVKKHISITLICCFLFGNLSSHAQDSQSDPYQPDIPPEQVLKLGEAREKRLAKDHEASKKILEEILREQPDYFTAYYNLALVYGSMEMPEEAIKNFEKAAEIRKEKNIQEYSIYNALGWFYMANEQYDAAEKNFLEAIKYEEFNDEQTNRLVFNNIGLLYYNQRKFDLAKKYLTIAIEKYNSTTAVKNLESVRKLEEKRRELDEQYVASIIQVAQSDAEAIGKKIWLNESAGKVEGLTAWNQGEDHASMGIGHFIWYSKNQEGPFQESFPQLLEYLMERKVKLPDWLKNTPECPWATREEFQKDMQSPKMKELREFLQNTIAYQTQFIIKRFESAFSKILATLPKEQQDHVREQFERVIKTSTGEISPTGVYALIDYVNFKGEGIQPSERYQNQGWGLLQVLQQMSGDSLGASGEFADAAEIVLKRRIENSPPERNETRFLKGWQNRLNTYRE